MKKNINSILILNGPNLNLLGQREQQYYGNNTIEDLEKQCQKKCDEYSIRMKFEQSNSESDLIKWIQDAKEEYDAIIINAAAYTHTSIAIRDALLFYDKTIIEVHLSNIMARENFRHKSFISDIAMGVICGIGTQGYIAAIEALAKNILPIKHQ